MEFGPDPPRDARSKVRYGLIVLEIALTLAIVTNCVSLIRDARQRARQGVGLRRRRTSSRSRSQPFAPAFKERGLPREPVRAGPRRAAAAARRQGRLEHALPPVAGRRQLDGDAARRQQGAVAADPDLQRRRGDVRDARASTSSRAAASRARRSSPRTRGSRRSSRSAPRASARTARPRSKISQDVVDQPGLRAPRVRRRLAARQAPRGHRRRPVPGRRRHRPLLQPVRLADPRVRHVLRELVGDVRRRVGLPRADGAGRARRRHGRRREGAPRRERRPQRARQDADPRSRSGFQARPEAPPQRPDGRHRPPRLRHVARDHRPHVLLGGREDAADRDAPGARRPEGATSCATSSSRTGS